MVCISCSTIHSEKFCPNCGEKSATKKITLNSIAEDSFSSVTNMDKGFLYNVKTLFLHPTKIVSEYINGRRKGILNPISYLILSITLYLIVISIFKDSPNQMVESENVVKSAGEKMGNAMGYFLRKCIKFFWILSIIPLAISLRIIYKRYNFWEHLAVSSFIIGQATLVGIVSYLIFKFPLIFDGIVYLAITWMIFRIFKSEKIKVDSILLPLAAIALFLIELILIVVIIAFFVHS